MNVHFDELFQLKRRGYDEKVDGDDDVACESCDSWRLRIFPE